jgi:hypothetical protein
LCGKDEQATVNVVVDTFNQLAVDHCASYGKVVKFLAVQPYGGGYISFACRWVPYGANAQPLRTLY